MVRSLTLKEVSVIGVVFTCAVGAAIVQGYRLQIQQHDTFAARAEANRFERKPLFAKRGIIEDRLGERLAWNEENIREVVAFPKNGSGVDVMMTSPSLVDQIQLDELKIQVREDED
jgi:aspartyl-tRNA synthetase